jgi:hypothetical protein
MHFTITPFGPEHGGELRAIFDRYLVHVDARRIDAFTGKDLWGAGVALQSREGPGFRPDVRIDLWERPEPGLGYRFDVGGERPVRLSNQTIDLTASVGYKSSGYLAGWPMRAGVSANVGGRFRF